MRVFKNKILKSFKGKDKKDDADVNYSLLPQPNGNFLSSTDFLSSLDLLCEGEIEGFVNPNGTIVNGIDVLQAVYLNDVPVLEVESFSSPKTKSLVDETPPVIIIVGDNPQVIDLGEGESFVDAGAFADGGETITTISNVNDQVLGSYTVTYSATDLAGNTGTAIRVVNVIESVAPVITILGSNPLTIQTGTVYTDAGATSDGGETITVINDQIDTSVVNIHQVIYSATDANGNTGTAIRIVNVIDTVPPVITISGDNPLEILRDSTYNDAGATADGQEQIFINSTVNTSAEGTYTVTYSATDGAGNTGTATRTVHVIGSYDIAVFGFNANSATNSNNLIYDSQANQWTWTNDSGTTFGLSKNTNNKWEILYNPSSPVSSVGFRTYSTYTSDIPPYIPWSDWQPQTTANHAIWYQGFLIRSPQYPESSYYLQGFQFGTHVIDGTYSFSAGNESEIEYVNPNNGYKLYLRMAAGQVGQNWSFLSPLGYEWQLYAGSSKLFWSDRLNVTNDTDKIFDPSVGGFTNTATFGTNKTIGTIS